jgi:MFS family permease
MLTKTAGLFPCITVYVMMNYRREETGRRMSYIFSCAAFAGAVGGLIAGGLVRIETGSMTGWQYLYVVGSNSLNRAPFADQVGRRGYIIDSRPDRVVLDPQRHAKGLVSQAAREGTCLCPL